MIQAICPAYVKKCVECSKNNHFREVCRTGKNRTVHDLEQEPDQHHEEVEHIDTMNIHSVYFNKKHLVITANLKVPSNQTSIIVQYKVDICCYENIMPLHMYKNMFPRATKEQLAATKNNNIQLKMFNRTTMTQLGM